MSEQKTGHWKWLHIRLTEKDYMRIKSKFEKSTDHKLSAYARKVLLDKPVTVKQRNQSLDDFLTELIKLRNELSAIGNNYNQVVKRLHVLNDRNELQNWLQVNEAARKMIQQKIEQIRTKIYSINDQWLRV